MGLIDNIREFLAPAQTQDIKKVAMNIQTGTVQTDNYAYMTAWYFNPVIGQPRGGTPITTMRQFAQTPQVSMAIKTIIDEVTGMEWEIVPKKGYEDTYNPQIMDQIVEFLQYPNRNGESFQDILKMLMKDILEIDAGVLVKVFAGGSNTEKSYTYTSMTDSSITTDIKTKALTNKATMTEIYCRDGGSFIVAPDMFGILPDDRPSYFQYSFLNANLEPKPFWKREISYYKMNPRSTTPYGWSPIESIFMVLEALNNAVRFNKKIFEEHAIPDGALSIIGADEEALGRFIDSWKQNVKGKPHKLVIFNEDMKFTPFQRSNADMEWLEGQKYYQRIVWAMYGVTPDELGFTETSNRSTGQSQSRVFLRRAVKPYTQLLETKITEDIIAEFYPDGMPEVELKFKFDESELQKEEHIEQREDVKLSILTINEVRLSRGLEPVEWGDQPIRQVGIQPIPGGDAIFEPTPSAPRYVPAVRAGNNILTEADEEAILDRDLTGGLERTFKKKPRPVIETGPRGGRIVGRDSRGNPIYAGKPGQYRPFEASDLEKINQVLDVHINEEKKLKQKLKDGLISEGDYNIERTELKNRAINVRDTAILSGRKVESNYDKYSTVADLRDMRDKNPEGYRNYKNELTTMTPHRFLEWAGADVNSISLEVVKDKIKEIAETGKVSVGFLDMDYFEKQDIDGNLTRHVWAKDHEGRHTAIAAAMMGINEIDVALLFPDMEINEIAAEVGIDNYGDALFRLKPQEGFEFFGNELKLSRKSWNQSPILKQLESMEIAEEGSEWEDWTPYYGFLDKYWDLVDDAVMKVFDNTVMKKTIKQDLNDFTFKIMSVLSTYGLKSEIRKYMNKSYNLGVENAENVVGVQVGTNNQDRALVDVYTEQQVDGYVLYSGKRWDGIKGVNNKLAIDIGNTVGKLWDEGKSIEDIRKAVETKLKTTTNHARMIARTESNRIANQAAYNTYAKSGVNGKIEWDASLDGRTSDICIALDGTQVNPGDFFTTIDGQKIQSPPAHVNCRSRVKFIPTESSE